jgi:hypothetical protein
MSALLTRLRIAKVGLAGTIGLVLAAVGLYTTLP